MHGIKFIHTADWHLGKNLHEHRLLEDQRKVLWDLLDLIDRESPDFLIVAGDIFDRSVPPAEALALLGEFLSELRSRSALPVVFLGGNHDSPSRLSYGAELFSIQDIYFRSLPRSFTSPVEIKAGGQKVQIWCLPFLRKYDLLPEDLAPMEKSETVGAEDSFFPETDDYEELSLYESALKRIRSLQDPQAKQILTAHLLTLGGSVSDSERPLVGGLGEIPSQWLEGFDYVALGHLHRPQEPQPGIHYSGSPLAYSFSEASDQKVWKIVEINSDVRVSSKEIEPPRPVRRISGELNALLDQPEYEPYVEAYLEITIEKDSIRPGIMTLLKKRFPYLLSLRQKKDEVQGPDLSSENWESRDFLGDFSAFWRFHYGQDPGAGIQGRFDELLEEER